MGLTNGPRGVKKKKKKKYPSFLSKHRSLPLFSREGGGQTAPPPPRGKAPCSQHSAHPQSRAQTSPEGSRLGAPRSEARPLRPRVDKAPLILAAGWVLGGLRTRLPFPSRRTKGKFDFVPSKGSLNLWLLLDANDMRWDPSQLLLKCIRGRHSAERDSPSLCLGEN